MENENTKREQARLDIKQWIDVRKIIRKIYGKCSYFYKALILLK